jgi:hypothetical protein
MRTDDAVGYALAERKALTGDRGELGFTSRTQIAAWARTRLRRALTPTDPPRPSRHVLTV